MVILLMDKFLLFDYCLATPVIFAAKIIYLIDYIIITNTNSDCG